MKIKNSYQKNFLCGKKIRVSEPLTTALKAEKSKQEYRLADNESIGR